MANDRAPMLRKYACVLFLGVALIFRVYGLGRHDFWYDEIGSISYAQYPWGNWNAPLYWVFLHFWIKIFPLSEFFFRLPSAIFSFISVILLFLAAKRACGYKIAVAAVIFMGLSPFQLWYAQEARDYSLALCLSLCSAFFLVKTLKDDKISSRLGFIITSLLAVYTNYFMLFLAAGQFLYLLYSRKLKEAVCFLFLLLVIFSVYLPRFLAKFKYVKNGFWISAPDWQSPFITIGNFILGYNSSLSIFILCSAAAGILCVWALVGGLRRDRQERDKIVFCVFLFIVPLLLVFIFSRLVFPVYLSRGLIIFSPYLYVFLACGIFLLRGAIRAVSVSLFFVALLFGLYGFFSDTMVMPLAYHRGVFSKKPVKPLVVFLENNLRPGDAVAITNQSIMPSVSFYLTDKSPALLYFFDPGYPDSTWQRPVQEDGVNIPMDKISLLEYDRFWVLSLDWDRDGNMDDNSVSVNKRMSQDFILEYSSCLEGVKIFRYARKSPREP